MRTTIHSRQSLPDIAVRECGALEAAFDLALRNDLGLTDRLEPGRGLEYLPQDIRRRQVVAALAARGIAPATALTPQDEERLMWGGIGYMGIESDFKVE